MICPYCGKENPEENVICGFCGGPLISAEAEAEPYSPEPKVTIIHSAPEVEEPPPSQQGEVLPPTQQVEVLPPAPAGPPPGGQGGMRSNRIWWIVGCAVLVLLLLCCAFGTITLNRIFRGIGSLLPEAIPTELSLIAVGTVPSEITVPASTPTAPSTSGSASASFTQGQLLFDDFSDPNSGWDRNDTGDYYTDYYSGTYRIVVYSDMSDSWANPDSNIFNDVSIEVEATKNGGPDDNDYGIICRYQGQDQFYYGVISSDGFYGITKVTSDTSILMDGAEMPASNYIYKGNATNYIRFDCQGDTLSLYVNGQLIDQQTDSDYTSGNVGLIAGTYDTAGTDILFDNFSVVQP